MEFNFATPRLGPNQSREVRYTILMEPNASDAIFVAPRIEMLRGRFGGTERPAAGGKPGFLIVEPTGTVNNPAHNETKMRYQGISEIPTVPPQLLRASGTNYSQDITDTYLQLPQIDPRIKALAEEVTRGSTNNYDKAARIELYLKSRFRYTLDLSGPPTRDPLAYFLFTKKAGHCEYFAAAMTVMLRSLGVPTRYVGGFLSGEYNDVGGDWIIRASDAHTWVEVFFPGYGWMTFDPTRRGAARPADFSSASEILGLVSVRVGRVGDQLRLRAPVVVGAERRQELEEFRRQRAEVLRMETRPRDGRNYRAR